MLHLLKRVEVGILDGWLNRTRLHEVLHVTVILKFSGGKCHSTFHFENGLGHWCGGPTAGRWGESRQREKMMKHGREQNMRKMTTLK